MNENIYQKRRVNIGEIISRINIEEPDNLPKIILSVSPCRSGSTALLRLFGYSGINSYYQPFKSILRWLAQDEDKNMTKTWDMPKEAVIYIKETLGPYMHEEFTLDPIYILSEALSKSYQQNTILNPVLEAHIRRLLQEKLHLLIIGRGPFATWRSWKNNFANHLDSSNSLFNNFLQVYHSVEQIRQKAIEQGITITHYVYERFQYSEEGVKNLFKKLGLKIKPVVKGWKKLPPFCKEGSNVFFYGEPDLYNPKKIHKKVICSDGLRFFNKANVSLTNDEKSIIRKNGLIEIYKKWKLQSDEELETTSLNHN